MLSKHTIVLATFLISLQGSAWAQETSKPQAQQLDSGSSEATDRNAANNPAHPLLTVDLWNYFAPSPEGFAGGISNQSLLRVAVPINAFGLHPLGLHHVFRLSRRAWYLYSFLRITTVESNATGAERRTSEE